MTTTPRETPDRDSKYMGEAWMKAAFSKDPSTQVGAVIIDQYNQPLGSGYNGLPRLMDDDSFDWCRPPENDPEAFCKYDAMIHAEINAMDHCRSVDLSGATLYVTALPCPRCMLSIISKEIERVVYYSFQSSKKSSLQNDKWRDKTLKLAKLADIKIDEFQGNIGWVADWVLKLQEMGVIK